MTVPRKLPPMEGQRERNVYRTHAAQSLGGGTAAARPVQQRLPDVKTYQAPIDTTAGIVLGDASGFPSLAIASTASGPGTAVASAGESIAIGDNTQAHADFAVAIGGATVEATGTYGVAIGLNADAAGANAVAIGSNGTSTPTSASGDRSVAIGAGAQAGDDEIALGTSVHAVLIRGALVLRDTVTFTLYRVTVTSGALTVSAYP